MWPVVLLLNSQQISACFPGVVIAGEADRASLVDWEQVLSHRDTILWGGTWCFCE